MPEELDLAPSADPADYDTRFFGHPRGLTILFFAELWERFSYYGMRALLILYLTASVGDGGLAFDAGKAAAVYAIYTSMVYLLGLPGGWIADQVLGQRRAVFVGGVLIAAGHFALAFPQLAAFYGGLLLIVCGTGLLKPNISAMVGQLYARGDERRDAGFSLFYMGINIGALTGPLVCSYLGERVDWHLGFAAAGVGMVLGLIVYVAGGRLLGDAGRAPYRDEPGLRAARRRQLGLGTLLAAALAVAVASLVAAGVLELSVELIADSLGAFLLVLTVVFFGWLFTAGDWSPVERGRLAAVVVLFLAAAVFWGAYEQAGSSLNLFARDLTDRTVAGFTFPAGWFQPVPALFVVLLAPVFAWLWVRLGRRQPSSPIKFALGLVFVGLGFVVMMGASTAAAGGVRVSPMWLIATYFLHVVGELCLSPVGLSTVTKLAPERVTGLMMGTWFLASAVGNYVGGRTAGLYGSLPLPALFGVIALTTIVAGALLALAARPIRRLMGGVR